MFATYILRPRLLRLSHVTDPLRRPEQSKGKPYVRRSPTSGCKQVPSAPRQVEYPSKAPHQLAHRFASKGRERAHILIGLPTVALSAVVCTSIFSSIGNRQDTGIQIIFGMLSLLAATLAALQTFLGMEDLSNKHWLADSGYSAIRQRWRSYRFRSLQQEAN